jgi:hypothetical protein
LLRFFDFAGDVTSHRQCRKGEEEKTSQIALPLGFFLRRCVNPRAASVGRAWRRRVALFLQTWNSSSVIPRFLGVFFLKKIFT